MKNLLKSLLLAASAFVLLAGCNQIGVSDATVDGATYTDGVCYLTISAEDFEGVPVAGRSASRTINPASLSDSGTTFSKVVLKGKSTITGADLFGSADGSVLDFEDHDDNANTPAVAQKEIPFGSWDLTLEAYMGTGTNAKLVLQGRSHVDLKKPAQSVAFTLKTDNVHTEGSVTLSGNFIDTDKVAATYEAGLYSLTDGTLKYSEGTSLTPKTVTAGSTEESASEVEKRPSFNFTKTGIVPGRYSFQVRFYNSENKQVGFYEDIVVVAPGRATAPTDPIACGEIINKLPASPENLMAYLVNNSEDEDGNYTVHLTWEDKSTNEENFVIYINEYKVADETLDGPYAILGVENKPADKKEVFWESAKNAGGSIGASSTWCEIKLPLNKIFDVSIRAQNFVGESKVSASVDACIRVDATGSVDGATAITSTHINRMAVKYDLDNGKLTLANGEEKTGVYTLYQSIYDEGISGKTPETLLQIDNNPESPNYATSAHLVSGRYPFDKWVYTAVGAPNTMQVLTAAGAEVKATYKKNTNITYTVDNKYYTVTATAKYGTGSDNVAGTSFDAKSNDDITFAVTSSKTKKQLKASSDTENPEYEDVEVPVNWIRVSITNLPGDTIDSGKISGTSYTFDGTGGLMSGPHTVTVKAHIDGEPEGTIYEFTFALGLER